MRPRGPATSPRTRAGSLLLAGTRLARSRKAQSPVAGPLLELPLLRLEDFPNFGARRESPLWKAPGRFLSESETLAPNLQSRIDHHACEVADWMRQAGHKSIGDWVGGHRNDRDCGRR